MADWQAAAERGEWGVLPPLRAALDRQLGRRVKPSVVYGLVQRHRWRKVAPDTRQPQADPPGPREWKKTLPENLAAVLTAAAVPDRPIRLRFQAEARFGRMARRRRCWAPAPLRPTVRKGYEREFPDVYGAGARRGTPPR